MFPTHQILPPKLRGQNDHPPLKFTKVQLRKKRQIFFAEDAQQRNPPGQRRILVFRIVENYFQAFLPDIISVVKNTVYSLRNARRLAMITNKIAFLLFMLPITCFAKENSNMNEPTVVTYVSLERYVGLWYEIAKIPNPFQKKCAKNTTAEYTIRKDGKINVMNRCTKTDGEIITALGTAKIVDKTTNAKLKVSFVKLFGINLFWGDYWIIGLDGDYRYAIVGDPSRKYGWVLSRTPQLSDEIWLQVNEILKGQGYNPEDFVKTIHETNE